MDNLSRNAMLARKSGMSYGQWKALHPNTMKAEKIPDQRECVCHYCGKTFFPKTNRPQKYCQYYCQNEAAKLRAKERSINNGQG
jgi:hypothetical protein